MQRPSRKTQVISNEQLKGACTSPRRAAAHLHCRSGSQVPDQDQLESTKLLKMEEGSSVRQRNPEKLQRHRSFDVTHLEPDDRASPTLNPARHFKSAESTIDNEQWRTVQSEEYVPNMPPTEPPQDPMSSRGEHGWPSFHNGVSMEHINPEYSGDVIQMPRESVPTSPLLSGIQDPFAFPHHGFSSMYEQYMYNQDPQVGDTG